MTATVRRRLLDAPGCEEWNAAIRRAIADYAKHPSTKFCSYGDCTNITRGRFCPGHGLWGRRSDAER